jgi:hypothetical protein
MKLYGFIASFPVVCVRDKNGHLIVKDGQHRLAIAETLGLTVYWVEEEQDFDVALVNCTSKTWQLKDYAQKHAANGIKQYQEGIDFAEQYHIPIGTAFALLAGTTTFGNCESQFIDGTFKVKDRDWADAVAGLYSAITSMSSDLKKVSFIDACMAVCRVEGFDPKRLISGAERAREKLVNYGNRDAFLDMMETLYNFHRKQLVPLKIQAVTAMRSRNAILKSKKAKQEKEAA